MRNKWFVYGEIASLDIYEALSSKERDFIDNFRDYMLISATKTRADEGVREVLRFRKIVNKSLMLIDIEDLRYFLKELKQSDFADHTKNKAKNFVHRFLKWGYKDWSSRFLEFEDIKMNNDAQNKKIINKKTLITEKDIEKLLEAEPSLYLKTFLICQAEGGLRTKEARELKWNQIIFEDDGFTTLNIPSKKNRNGTIKINQVVVKVAGNFLKKLKEQQQTYEIKTEWVFPSPKDKNKPISKSVNLWFNNLCKKVLGRPANNYLLRHSKGTQLQEKVRNGTLSKDNAISFMRHSEKMFDKTYSHMDQEDIRQLIKKQIYNTEELTKQDNTKIKELEKEISKMTERLKNIEEFRDRYVAEEQWKGDIVKEAISESEFKNKERIKNNISKRQTEIKEEYK
jgi:integrase